MRLRRPRAAQSVMIRAIRLREALYRIFQSAAPDGKPLAPDLLKLDLQILNREIAIARARERLVHSAGAFLWASENDALDQTLCSVAISAAELLTSGSLVQLRHCADEKCGWLFLDTSRNHSRHWCDMRDCGNRAKVARFRQRLRE